jgi:3-deoxy-D-manno-octulosonic-acid transferase
MSGSDSSLPSVMVLYAGTFLVTLFLIIYWLIMLAQKNPEKKASLQARLKEQKTATRPRQSYTHAPMSIHLKNRR